MTVLTSVPDVGEGPNDLEHVGAVPVLDILHCHIEVLLTLEVFFSTNTRSLAIVPSVSGGSALHTRNVRRSEEIRISCATCTAGNRILGTASDIHVKKVNNKATGDNSSRPILRCSTLAFLASYSPSAHCPPQRPWAACG